jgi:hypothetical protein
MALAQDTHDSHRSRGRQTTADQTPPGYSPEEWKNIKDYQLHQADAAKKVSVDSPAMPDTPGNPETLCGQPKFPDGNTRLQHFYSLRWWPNRTGATLPVDMTNESCIPKQYDVWVPNRTEVTLEITHDIRAKCTAVETYADDAVKDYGSVLSGEFTSAVLAGMLYATRKPEQSSLSIKLPSDNVKNTAATVIISCHADQKGVKVGVQQKVAVHYGSPDLFTASTGAIVSTLGEKSYGVITIDTGQKNSDGTPVTASSVGVTSSSSMQFVPIALVNFNYAGNDETNFNAQFGVGINPNGSSTNVEYFLSPLAFSTHHVYIAPGVHIAQSERINGNFTQGEVVGSGFTLPTKWETTYKFGVTISVQPYK